MKRVGQGVYRGANLVLPLREVTQAAGLVIRTLRRTALVTLSALTTSVRSAREQASPDDAELRRRNSVGAPADIAGLVPQWWSGVATALLGLFCLAAAVWLASGLAGVLALLLIGSGMLGSGLLIAGASAYVVQRAHGRVESVPAWLRRPALWTPYS